MNQWECSKWDPVTVKLFKLFGLTSAQSEREWRKIFHDNDDDQQLGSMPVSMPVRLGQEYMWVLNRSLRSPMFLEPTHWLKGRERSQSGLTLLTWVRITTCHLFNRRHKVVGRNTSSTICYRYKSAVRENWLSMLFYVRYCNSRTAVANVFSLS